MQPLWKTVCLFPTKLNTLLPCYPTSVLLGIYPKELNTYAHAKTCTQMFMAALFLIAKTWKHPRCPPADEQINKVWCIQTLEYYPVLKINELPSHEKDMEET